MAKSKLDEKLSQIEQLVQEYKQRGAEQLYYIEVAARLQVSPQYARELLRIYATKNGMKYIHGYLLLEKKEVK